jgi:hypothetical protein
VKASTNARQENPGTPVTFNAGAAAGLRATANAANHNGPEKSGPFFFDSPLIGF